MAFITIYLPIDMDSGPYCPRHCVGRLHRRSTCAVFWRDLERQRISGTPGYRYAKCGECLELSTRAMDPPKVSRVIQSKWRAPPDAFPSE